MHMSESVPTFTKLYLACSITLSVLVFFQSIDPYNLTYTFKATIFEVAFWRPITAILYLNRISLLLPFQLIFAYIATSKISSKVYLHQPANLAWLFLFSVIALVLFSTLISSLYFYGSSFVMIMLMTWAIRYPTDYITLWRLNLPIYAITMIALGSTYKNYMAGLLIGFIYGTIKGPTFIHQHGDLLPTPAFLENYFTQYHDETDKDGSVNFIKKSEERNYYFTGKAVQLN